jgi:Fe2+ transport system protein FeoA
MSAVTRRPAESAGAAAGVGGAIAAIAAHNTLAAALAAVGLVPGAVTWLVAHGGLSGALRTLWRGRT